MKRSRCCLVLMCLWSVCGCGSEQYDQRLRDTNAFFEYQQSLDRVLQRFWEDRNLTIAMRIPHGLAQLPRPPVAKEGEPVAIDTRHPVFLNQLVLPGLVEAWRGDFACDDGQTRPVWLYVCSNHTLFHRPESEGEFTPDQFNKTITEMVGSVLGRSLSPLNAASPGTENALYAETCPRIAKYTIPRTFTAVSVVPPPEYTNAQIDFMPKCQLYTHENGQIQVAVLLVYPASVRERLDERLRTALETFRVTNAVPKAGKVQQATDPKF